MKALSIWKPASAPAGPPTQEEMERMGTFIGEAMQAGVLLDTGGVMPTGRSLRMRRAGSQIAVTDGPFTETKEIIGGYAVLQTKSREELEHWVRRFLELAGDGTADIIEIAEFN
jgi:hypothetical protein